VDAKADQFSMGVVAFQLLARQLPFTAPNDQALMFQIVNAEPAPLLEANPALPPDVDRVIRTALAKVPDQRFPTCGAFARALEQAFAPPEPATVRTVRAKSGANRILAAVAGALLLAAFVLYFASRALKWNPSGSHPVKVASGGANQATEGRSTGKTGNGPENRSAKERAKRFGEKLPGTSVKDEPIANGRGKSTLHTSPNEAKFIDRQRASTTEAVAAVENSPKAFVPPVIARGPQPGQVKVNEKDGLRYVWIPAGKFMMGCSPQDNECFGDEKPAHEVEITKGFWLGQTSVTVAAWKRYRVATGKPALPDADNFGRSLNEAAGDDNVPAADITWDEARGFCEWGGVRLPTEAEWEYAARAGSSATRYGSLDSVAWYGDNSGRQRFDSMEIWRTDSTRYSRRLFENGNGSHAVGQRQPNAWNLYDMLGNVWQWTADWYGENYYPRRDSQDPLGPPGGTQRVLRGGSWYSDPGTVRASRRNRAGPASRFNDHGVRCAGN